MTMFGNLFHRNKSNVKVGGMEDFMTLIRVYFQAAIAARLGITNLAALPDLRVFKHTLKIPTENNRLGLGEGKRCRRMLVEMYGVSDNFFREIDASMRKRCRSANEAQPYLLVFQDFSQNLMLSLGQLMQWKLRLPSFFHKALRNMTTKTVHEVLTGNNWRDDGMRKCVAAVRKGGQRLGFSEEWMVEYGHTVLMLAKKEPRNKIDNEKQ